LLIRTLPVAALRLLDVDTDARTGVTLESAKMGSVGEAGEVEGVVLPDEPQRSDVREAVAIDAGQTRRHVSAKQRGDLGWL
jgi:hypothetical protein